ncbi:MAG TPA: RusA family crossover junction endodeoxyribonuclease [Longimicrobium sp.]
MYAFVASTRPRSVQAKKTLHYKNEIVRAFQRYVPAPAQLDGPLYGVVYYFHNVPSETDADNISKPVWDCLEGLAFENDRSIRLRIAGMHDLSLGGIEALDTRLVPEEVVPDLRELVEAADHVLYIEVGRLSESMFRFGLEVL